MSTPGNSATSPRGGYRDNNPLNVRPGETDAQYASRLQAMELGGMRHPIIANTPAQENPTVINQRLNEIYASRFTAAAVVVTNLPQIIAAIVILCAYWNDNSVCGDSYTNRWKAWSMVSAVRLLAYMSSILYLFFNKIRLDAQPEALANALTARNAIDLLGFIWFIVGIVWLFDYNGSSGPCDDPNRSPLFNLCEAMILIFLVQISLPCLTTILLIPVVCFCMPCLIRVLARIQDPQAARGANEATINNIQLITITQENLNAASSNSTCPICISEMVVGDQARVLPCKHFFHKTCVDEWLGVNATCPTCRASISGNDAGAVPTPVSTAGVGPAPYSDRAASPTGPSIL